MVLGYFVKDGDVGLGLRKKTPWSGKLSGPGGNREECDKSLKDALVREVKVELDVNIALDEIEKRAEFKIFRPGKKPILLHVYTMGRYQGDFKASDEMDIPWWFPIEYLPIELMVPGDEHWVYRMLKGEFLGGEIHRSLDFETLIYMNVYEVDPKSFVHY
ncbi:MAG: hypothetical protein ACD_8C00006G0001 [uncultured bacterium]|nr:MAG: hypothetical protein ACD_8C00006G0001 [uncultured bacterium]